MFWKSLWFQDGREVVGLNNLAFVHFEGTDGSQVIQDLYWFSTNSPVRLVRSRFKAELDPESFIMPPFPNNALTPVAITTDSTQKTR